MSRWLSGSRFAVPAITLSLAGAAFVLFVCGGLGWWWDGFFLGALGMVLGASLGLFAEARIERWRHSDAPSIFGGHIGILTMVALWLYLPEDNVRVLGHLARAIIGAVDGLALALSTIPYPDRGKSSRSAPERVGLDRPADR
jgi:hypothetical protein